MNLLVRVYRIAGLLCVRSSLDFTGIEGTLGGVVRIRNLNTTSNIHTPHPHLHYINELLNCLNIHDMVEPLPSIHAVSNLFISYSH